MKGWIVSVSFVCREWILSGSGYCQGVDIVREWILSRSEYHHGVDIVREWILSQRAIVRE